MPFDPICGREVSHRSWPLQYAETTYWFCSRACRDDFSGAPRMLITLGPKTAARPLHLNGLPAQS
jgi:YHS domain-containing protein